MIHDGTQHDEAARSTDQDEPRRRPGSKEKEGDSPDGPNPALPVAGPAVVSTTDAEVLSTAEGPEDWKAHPDATMTVETSDVRGTTPIPVTVGRPVDGPAPAPRHRPRASRREGVGANGRDENGDADRHRQRDNTSSAATFSPMRTMMLAGAVALVCGILGALGYEYFFGGKSGSLDDKQAASSEKKSGGGSGSEKGKAGASKTSKGSNEEETGAASNEGDTIPGFTTARDADSLRKQIGHLAQRLDAIQHRLDGMKPSPDQTPPDTHTLQIKVGELARTIDDVATLPTKVRRFGNRLEDLEQKIKMVQDQVALKRDEDLSQPVAVPGQAPRAVPSTPTTSATFRSEATAEEIDAPDAALEQAISLFKLGQYPLAASILAKLRQTQPDDARVWYFSALVNGLTTGKWDGPTRQFVEKGIEREHAGTPPRTSIDAALRGVTRTQGGDWLTGFRERITKKS